MWYPLIPYSIRRHLLYQLQMWVQWPCQIENQNWWKGSGFVQSHLKHPGQISWIWSHQRLGQVTRRVDKGHLHVSKMWLCRSVRIPPTNPLLWRARNENVDVQGMQSRMARVLNIGPAQVSTEQYYGNCYVSIRLDDSSWNTLRKAVNQTLVLNFSIRFLHVEQDSKRPRLHRHWTRS